MYAEFGPLILQIATYLVNVVKYSVAHSSRHISIDPSIGNDENSADVAAVWIIRPKFSEPVWIGKATLRCNDCHHVLQDIVRAKNLHSLQLRHSGRRQGRFAECWGRWGEEREVELNVCEARDCATDASGPVWSACGFTSRLDMLCAH